MPRHRLWAGPLCAGLLARVGAGVLRIESLGRPDPTLAASPRLDAFANGAKIRLPLDLRSREGQSRLLAEIEAAEAVLAGGTNESPIPRLPDRSGRFNQTLNRGFICIT